MTQSGHGYERNSTGLESGAIATGERMAFYEAARLNDKEALRVTVGVSDSCSYEQRPFPSSVE
jgi:hypothetical protein